MYTYNFINANIIDYRKCEATNDLMRPNKIHLSLAPIPINTHPFLLNDICIFTCIYNNDNSEVSL